MYNPQLDTFICVADSGSFGKASEKLYITTPAVIKQINLLENSLGLKLFIRSKKGVSLTNAGRSYYNDARKIIALSKEALSRARRADSERHVVRIGVSCLTSTEVFNNLIPKIQASHPEIQFQLVPFENTSGSMNDFLNNLGQKIDVALLMCDFIKHPNYQVLPLSYEPIGCAVSINHPLAHKEMLKPEDLFNHNFFLLKKGANAYLDILRDNIEKKYPQIHIVDLETFNIHAFNRCESSRNMMFGIEKWNGKHPLVKVVPVDWDFKVSLGLVYPSEPSDTVRTFIDAACHDYRAVKK